ncbi:MAG: hypothetical protein KDK76_01585, partial [Chlamydiia bacterium]|nr:hypothetical protein [Chlamydiia bacterium]
CLAKKTLSTLINAMGALSRDMEWAGCIGSDLYVAQKFSWIGSMNEKERKKTAKLYAKLIKKAIDEGDKGNLHKEAHFLFLAEFLSGSFYLNSLSRTSNQNVCDAVKSDMKRTEKWGNGPYMFIGSLSHFAQKELAEGVESVKQLINQCPILSHSPTLRNLNLSDEDGLLEALLIIQQLADHSPYAKSAFILLYGMFRIHLLSEGVNMDTPKTLPAQRVDSIRLSTAVGLRIERLNQEISRYKRHLNQLEEQITKDRNILQSISSIPNLVIQSEIETEVSKNLDEKTRERDRLKSQLKEVGIDLDIQSAKIAPLDAMDFLKVASSSELARFSSQAIEKGKEVVKMTKTLEALLPDPYAGMFD